MIRCLFLFCLLAPCLPAQWAGRPAPQWEERFQAWVADVHKHVFPNSFGRDLEKRAIEIEACRNEHAVIQLGLRSPEAVKSVSVRAGEFTGGGRKLGARVRVRYPGLMPVDENAQYTPDPLWEVNSVALRPYQSQGVWVDLKVPAEAHPGVYESTLQLLRDGKTVDTFRLKLDVVPATLPDPADFRFFLNILFDPSSIARFQKLPLWGEEHWRRIERYIENLAAHGQKTITAFIVDDPWEGDTGFAVRTIVGWRADGKLEPGKAMRLSFDFSNFDRFVTTCLRAGIRDHIECWSPLVQPHADHSTITYLDTAARTERKIVLPAGSPEYKEVWGQFARAFQDHLRAKGWLDKTFLAFDEISTGVLDRVIPFFHEVAPDLKLMISGGDEKGKHMAESRELAFHYGYYTQGSGAELPDIPARRKAGKRTLLYTAVTPLYPNTFLFSQPLESRYLGWVIRKWDFDGYIRWAWNFWPATLWDQPFYKWHSGDMFFVYPGEQGPVDSIRWEMLREGIEDYECLWLARTGLDKLRGAGPEAGFVAKAERDLARAMELATLQFDRTKIPKDPVPARMEEARKLVNGILREVHRLGAAQ
ncbi:MAG: DUF4091 domain-containing protein [Bryobacteraceae bacterium]|nr:DUF4091 domain-containing protein [Bryobacteraceae bacterium]